MADGTDGRPVEPSEDYGAFAVKGNPTHLTDKGAASTATPGTGGSGTQEVGGRPGGPPSPDEALRDMGGLHNPKKISSIRSEGGPTTPDLPLSADPANEGW